MRILEEALTFDDVLLVPAYSEILPREVDLSTHVTRRIRLNVPLISAAMDTVTEARLAITIAQEGGIGIIHKSMTIEAQAREVERVKKFESGVIRDPITVSPNMSIREVLDLTRARGISGVPVVVGRKAVGIVTHRDLRFEDKLEAPVSSVMTPQERLVTVREDAPKERGARAAAQAPHREAAGRERRARAGRHDHREGLPEGQRIPARLQGRRRAAARRGGASARRPTRSSASPRCVRRAWTSWWWTPRTGTPRASSRR